MTSKRDEIVAVAIDKDKGSQYALKWAVDNLLVKGKTVTLIHVKPRTSSIPTPTGNHVSLSEVSDEVARAYKSQVDSQAKDLFLPFRIFCTRKDIHVNEVVLEDLEIAKAICDYVKKHLIEKLVLGAASRNGFTRRFKNPDVPSSVSKAAPEFCSVYVISKGKLSSVQSAKVPVPNSAPNQLNQSNLIRQYDARPIQVNSIRGRAPSLRKHTNTYLVPTNACRSPFTRGKASNRSYGELSVPDSDISFVSSGRPSTDRMHPSFSDEMVLTPRLSGGSDTENRLSLGSPFSGPRASDSSNMFGNPSSSSQENVNISWSSSQNPDDVEAEMRRLKQELKQTMDMYSTACKEALSAKQKATELHRWKVEEQRRLREARLAEEAALEIAEREKEKCRAAIEAAEAAQRLAELEAQKRMNAERRALKEAEEKKKVLDALAHSDVRYRKYSIEEIETATEYFADSRKIGEGGYGPVYKCYLDHTPVAIKVLRPDAAQGRSQFQQEVEVLSCIRHPNMVLLLGACPEYGCLVYEHMANGSLEDRLFRREYQQTGMLGIKSDIYSLGVMFLQLVTAKPPMGLTHHVERAIEKGTFGEMLDPAIPDWPVEEATNFAKLALKCAELRRKDRPDLRSVVLPELNRLRAVAEELMPSITVGGSPGSSPSQSQVSTSQVSGLTWKT
ncbi:hypothetical protein RJ639_020410, partial [Escallonia herrerae]